MDGGSLTSECLPPLPRHGETPPPLPPGSREIPLSLAGQPARAVSPAHANNCSWGAAGIVGRGREGGTGQGRAGRRQHPGKPTCRSHGPRAALSQLWPRAEADGATKSPRKWPRGWAGTDQLSCWGQRVKAGREMIPPASPHTHPPSRRGGSRGSSSKDGQTEKEQLCLFIVNSCLQVAHRESHWLGNPGLWENPREQVRD